MGLHLLSLLQGKQNRRSLFHNEGFEAASQHGWLRDEFWRDFLKIAVEVYLGKWGL